MPARRHGLEERAKVCKAIVGFVEKKNPMQLLFRGATQPLGVSTQSKTINYSETKGKPKASMCNKKTKFESCP